MTARTFLFQAVRMGTQCCANGPAIGLARSSDTKARFGVRNSVSKGRAQRPAVQTLQRASSYHIVHTYRSCAVPLTRKLCACCSKIWDTYSGQPLHSFPHNHIVRSVAISPSHLLTGGQEKKVRIFDIGRPDAEPDILSEGGGLSHDGTIKSVVWFDENTGVSGGEDRIIKWVIACLSLVIFLRG
jgi:WD40 repeat protein